MSRRIVVGAIGLKGSVFVEALLNRAVPIKEIISYQQPDDKSDSFGLIKSVADRSGIAFVEARRPSFQPKELVFLVGWQFLLPPQDSEIVVFHDSLLPRYRGFAPTVTALIKGEAEIGVTALSPTSLVDDGPIYGQRRIAINYPVKIKAAIEAQAGLMADLAADLVQCCRDGPLVKIAQESELATFSVWRDEDDYEIDWRQPAADIQRFVDALGYPYSGARTSVNGKTIRVWDVSIVDELQFEIRHVGKIWRIDNGCPTVICGSGLIRIDACTTEDGLPYRFERLRMRLGEI